MSFSTRLKSTRKNRGLSQQKLADEAGLSLRSVQNYEAGTRMPNSLAIAQRLAEVLEVSAEYLLEGHELGRERAGETGSKEQISELLAEIGNLFAGGELPEEDKDAVLKAIIDAYWDAKGKK